MPNTLMILACALAAQSVTSEKLQGLIAASNVKYSSLYCEYEGTLVYPLPAQQASQGLEADGLALVFTGRFRRRQNGDARVDYFDTQKTSGATGKHSHCIIGGVYYAYNIGADEPVARAAVRKATPNALDFRCSIERIFLRELVAAHVEANFAMTYKGEEAIGDDACWVVEFNLTGSNVPAERAITEVLWICPEKDFHVLKRERRFGGKLADRLSEVKVERFTSKAGRSIWLPVFAKCDGFMTLDSNRKPAHSAEPVFVEEYNVMTTSVLFDQPMKDADFMPPLKRGDEVTDDIKGRKYFYGGPVAKRSTTLGPDQEANEAALDEALADAKGLASELRAPSRERESNTSYSGWLPWLACAALGAAVAITTARRWKRFAR